MSSSKMVNDRQRAAAIVSQAALTHADAVGARLDEQLAPGEDGSSNAAALLRRLGETLQRSMDALVAADQAHEDEKADDGQVRREVEEAVEGLYREVVDLRAGLEAASGVAATEEAGFSGTTPRQAIALARLAQVLLKRLPTLANLPATRRGLTFDAVSYDGPLSQALDRLDKAQQSLRREQRELEATLMIKKRVMNDHDLCFLNIARTLEALFRLAGFEELANRVRPSTRRPGQVENDPEAPAEPAEPDIDTTPPEPDEDTL